MGEISPELEQRIFATSDHIMAAAAESLEMEVVQFD